LGTIPSDLPSAEPPNLAPAAVPDAAAADPHHLALRLLTLRARTTAEMRDALAERGVAENLIALEVTRLAAAGLLNDATVAVQHARRRLRTHPRAPRAIARELTLRGVDRETAAAAIREAADDENELDLARRAAKDWLSRHVSRRSSAQDGENARTPEWAEESTRAGGDTTGNRLAAYLARRGFSGPSVGAVLREHGLRVRAMGRGPRLSRRARDRGV
jgi:regulatory protein